MPDEAEVIEASDEPFVQITDLCPHPLLSLIAVLLVLVVWMPAYGQDTPAASLVSAHQAEPSQPETSSDQFHVFGHVEAPGSYRWFRAMTVKRAIERADGYTSRGSKDDLEIQRFVDGKLTTFAVKEDDPVQPDDVIMVRASRY